MVNNEATEEFLKELDLTEEEIKSEVFKRVKIRRAFY